MYILNQHDISADLLLCDVVYLENVPILSRAAHKQYKRNRDRYFINSTNLNDSVQMSILFGSPVSFWQAMYCYRTFTTLNIK